MEPKPFAMLERARSWSLSCARCIQSTVSHIHFPKIHSNFFFLSIPKSSEWSLPFGLLDQNFVCLSHLSHACTCPAHVILHDLITLNNIWRSVQVIKLLIMQSLPGYLYFFPLRSKCSHHIILKFSVHVPFLMCGTKFHTHTKEVKL